jgi:hypothetical protein
MVAARRRHEPGPGDARRESPTLIERRASIVACVHHQRRHGHLVNGNIAVGVVGISSPGGKLCPKIRAGTSRAQLYAVIKAAAFEAREPELIPIRRNPGFRNGTETLNRTTRIRADAAGGLIDSACAPHHSVAVLHGFAARRKSSDHGRGIRIQESGRARFCGPASRLAHNWDGMKDARQGYLSSQTSSMRQLLIMLLTIIVHPFTCGCQQYATRL